MRQQDSIKPPSPGFHLTPLSSALRRVLWGRPRKILLASGMAAIAAVSLGNPFPASLELSALDGSNGFKLLGSKINVAGGDPVVSDAGDINGDGIDDVIIGAMLESPNGKYSAGSSFVVFGRVQGYPANLELSTLDGTNGFAINGIAANDFSGSSVSGAEDVNGDGIDDLIIGAHGADPNGERSGESYIVFGTSQGFPANLELSALDGNNGFKISGTAAYDRAGRSVSGAGDVNGDGISDVIIGAPYADPNGAGAAYVVFGSNQGFPANLELSALDGNNGFKLSGVATDDATGFAVSDAGDINGDGIDDVLIGARAINWLNKPGTGYVVFGSTQGFTANLELSTLDGNNGFKLSGVAAKDQMGWAVSGAGDVNGDGIGDVIIGAPDAFDYSGASFVVFGTTQGFPANIELSSLDGSNGFRFSGLTGQNEATGRSVSGAGDVNGDGIDDLIIGAPTIPNGLSYGASLVVFGTTQGFPANFDRSTLNGTNGFAVSGNEIDSGGTSVSGAGDINDDGIRDLIIGGVTRQGQSYVVFGEGAAPPVQAMDVTVQGLLLKRASCDNLKTGQKVLVSVQPGSTSADCVKAGLSVSENDKVGVRLQGTVPFNSRTVKATVNGFSLQSAVCENQKTKQKVTVRLKPGSTVADCTASGLRIRPRDSIGIRLVGKVTEP